MLSKNYFRIAKNLPKQLPDTDASAKFQDASIQTRSLLLIMMVASFGVTLVSEKTGSEFYLITLINALQIIIHLPIYAVAVPSNVATLF